MKRLLSIGILLLCLAVACNRQVSEPAEGPSPELTAIDSLMWHQPDSALAVLIDYLSNDKDTECYVSTNETFDNHYAQLLASELLYKNDYAQTNRMELRQAVAYFDSLARQAPPLQRGAGGFPPFKGVPEGRGIHTPNPNDILVFLTARAHYINGVGYYENDSVVEACTEYIKALETMEEHFEEKELVSGKARLMALTHTHITALFSRFYLHEQTVYFGKKSLEYYKKYDASPHHVAWILNKIGAQYDMMDNDDTASIYYCNALNILPDTNNITYRDIATHLAFLSYKMGGSSSASLKLLKGIATKAESDKEFFSRCMNIGEVFYHEKLFDSAWFYLSRVFHESQNVNSRKQAAEWLVEICKTQGEETEAIEYAEYLVPFANVEENQSSIKSQLTELYKSYAQQEQERLYRQEKMKSLRWLMAIVGSFLILMLSFIILYHTNRKKKQHLETQIKAERQAHSMQQKALSGKLKKSNKALHDALQQLDGNSSYSVIQSKPKKDYTSFVEAPICRHILDTVHQQNFKSKIEYLNYKEYSLQKEQLLALRVAADENMDGFTLRLRKRFRGLTDEDVTYCCLYLLDITDADIAALMQKAYATVCERRRKIKRIVGGEDNLTYILRTLL